MGQIQRKQYKEYKVSNKKSRDLYEKLILQIKDSNFSFSQKELNITEKESSHGMMEGISISDGITYQIMIFQAGKYSPFSTSNPRTFIGNNYPGKEERIRFMKLYNEFENKLKLLKWFVCCGYLNG